MEYKVTSLVVTTGSTLELLRQICLELGSGPLSNSMDKVIDRLLYYTAKPFTSRVVGRTQSSTI